MELNWFKFYSCLIAYVTEFVCTNLHVDATIMKNKRQKSFSQVSPMKEKLFNEQIPSKDRQASGRTVEKEQHDCRQNVLHNLWDPCSDSGDSDSRALHQRTQIRTLACL